MQTDESSMKHVFLTHPQVRISRFGQCCFTGQISVRRKRQGGTFSEFCWKHHWWSHPQESEERWAVLARQLPKVEDLLQVLQATFAAADCKMLRGLLAVAVFACQGAIWNWTMPMHPWTASAGEVSWTMSMYQNLKLPMDRWKNCFWRHLMPQKRWVTRINSRLYREFRRHLQNVEHSFTTSHCDHVW